MATCSTNLAEKTPRTEGFVSQGHKEVAMTERLHTHQHKLLYRIKSWRQGFGQSGKE